MEDLEMFGVIDGHLEAYKRLDVGAMAVFFDPKIEMYRLSDGVMSDSGIEAVKIKYEIFFKRSPNLRFELLSRKVFKNYVFDHERITGFLDKVEPVEAMAIYQVEGNLIRRVWLGL